MHPAEKIFVVKIKAKKEPLYNLPSDDQMYVTPDGRLFVVYDDDDDEENEDGSHPLHDVTDQYEVTVEKANVK